jgi:hypothetical protein
VAVEATGVSIDTKLKDVDSSKPDRCCGSNKHFPWRLLHYISGRARVEAGSNTSTVSLRVVGGDEKGSLESETVKYGRESQGTLIRV